MSSSWSSCGTCNYPNGNSFFGDTCSGAVDFAGAVAFCENMGARLCTWDEISDKVSTSTGCSYNDDMLWTSTECGTGYYYTGYGSGGSSQSCEAITSTHEVRCCADMTGCSSTDDASATTGDDDDSASPAKKAEAKKHTLHRGETQKVFENVAQFRSWAHPTDQQ